MGTAAWANVPCVRHDGHDWTGTRLEMKERVDEGEKAPITQD